MKTLKQKLAERPAKSRQRVKQRTEQLIAEEFSLRTLRTSLELTQEQMAELLNIRQAGVSRIENRSDVLLSTLQSYIEAMGGKLTLIAEFPNKAPVILNVQTKANQEQRL